MAVPNFGDLGSSCSVAHLSNKACLTDVANICDFHISNCKEDMYTIEGAYELLTNVTIYIR